MNNLFLNIKALTGSFITVLLLISCDADTSSLGMSLVPDGDNIKVDTITFSASTRSIVTEDSLLDRTTTCYLGRYTNPRNGSFLTADYITQLNCVENFEFPDSVYGINGFRFPEWVDDEMQGVKPYKADLRLYFSSFFGDPANSLKVEVYPLDKIIDGDTRYYADVNPADFYDETAKPLASVMISPVDYNRSDSLRQSDDYYNNITISLPDSVARIILEKYYEPNGKKNFADASSFIKNVWKGFYLRCVQGDGTVMAIDKTVLDVNFKYLAVSSSGNADSLLSVVAEFSGNNEVMQLNKFSDTGRDILLADSSCTYMKTPFGLLTEISLPVDEMKMEAGTIINSASIQFTRLNEDYFEYSPKAPKIIMLAKKSEMHDFFEKNAVIDNIVTYVTSYNSVYNSYSFSNIARLIEDCYDDREEWMKSNGYDESDVLGKQAYERAFPDWNKAVIVPVKTKKDSNGSVVGYTLDSSISCVKLVGGPKGSKLNVKVIKTVF